MKYKVSKEAIQTKNHMGVMVHGYNVERFDHFLGRVLTMVETLGLQKGQEEAFKSILKQEVWDLWEHPKYIEEKEDGFGAVLE